MSQPLALLILFIFCYWITAAFWVEMAFENKYTDHQIVTPWSLYRCTNLNKLGSIVVFILITLSDPLYFLAKIVIGVYLLSRKVCSALFLKKEED